MSVVKVKDMAFCRMQSPDLDQAEEFLLNFGLKRSHRTADRLYMRGTDSAQYLHVTHLGPPKFLGFAFYVDSMDDLEKMSQTPGASKIEDMNEPGGGKRVVVKEPNGYDIELVYGIEPLPELPVTRDVKLNWGTEKYRRTGDLVRIHAGPSEVKRIAHGVFMTTDYKKTQKWFEDMLGFIPSDSIYDGDKSNVIASFNRADRGPEYVDHHIFLCLQGEKTGMNHVSFEVQSIDDVMLGHEHLKSKNKYEHAWGIGRHVLGSQVFDYWKDPWGRIHEHWTDTDVLNNQAVTNYLSAEEGLNSQWGEPAPEAFITHATP